MTYKTSHPNFTTQKLNIKFNNIDYSLKKQQMKNPQLYINQNNNNNDPREQAFKIHDNKNVARQHHRNIIIQQK